MELIIPILIIGLILYVLNLGFIKSVILAIILAIGINNLTEQQKQIDSLAYELMMISKSDTTTEDTPCSK